MARATKSMSNLTHQHACAICDLRYEDACGDPKIDVMCGYCRDENGLSKLPYLVPEREYAFYPTECCLDGCEPASKESIAKRRLAGEGPWWICKFCGRSHAHHIPTAEHKEKLWERYRAWRTTNESRRMRASS